MWFLFHRIVVIFFLQNHKIIGNSNFSEVFAKILNLFTFFNCVSFEGEITWFEHMLRRPTATIYAGRVIELLPTWLLPILLPCDGSSTTWHCYTIYRLQISWKLLDRSTSIHSTTEVEWIDVDFYGCHILILTKTWFCVKRLVYNVLVRS